MKTVLVAYASRMGSTQEIATAIGDQLTSRGFEVQVVAAAAATNAGIFDAVVLGSALYMGRWDRDAVDYLKRNGPDLADRPTWLFQSGPSGPPGGVRPTPTPRAVRRLCDKIGLAAPTTFGGNSTVPAPRASSRDGSRSATSPATSATGTRSGPGPMTSPTGFWPSARPPEPDSRARSDSRARGAQATLR